VKRTLAAAAVAFVALVVSVPSSAVPPAARGDVNLLIRELERIHPDPYHSISRAELRATADRLIAKLPELDDDEMLVELLRLVASLGEREGHTGISLFANDRLHFYPLYVYGFREGVYAVATVDRPALVGARVVAIAGRPVAELLRLVEPLVTRDNVWGLRAYAPQRLLCAEILKALGVTASADRATFTLELRSGARRDLELRAVPVSAYVARLREAFPHLNYSLPQRRQPLFLRRLDVQQWLTTIDGRRTVYLAYNSTMEPTGATARRLRQLLRRPRVRRVVVDLRSNGGGDIQTYSPLLEGLRSREARRKRLVLLIGRFTFSAAVHFAIDVRRTTDAVLVGEPAGGAPNHYSDTDPVKLPVTGWTVRVPRIHWVKMPGRRGLTLEPDVRVELKARDFFAGRDPVLAAALAMR
jgi:hypothetical protein